MERIFLWKTSSSDLIREVAENVPFVGIPEGPPFRKLRERMGHPHPAEGVPSVLAFRP